MENKGKCAFCLKRVGDLNATWQDQLGAFVDKVNDDGCSSGLKAISLDSALVLKANIPVHKSFEML